MDVIGRKQLPFVRPGLTLVECVLALTILPLAVTGIAFAVVSGQQQAAEALRQTHGMMVAQALMEEILSKPYADPGGSSALGPESGETSRSLYDNADDYHGFSESGGSLSTAAGVALPSSLQGFSRSVSCSTTTVTVASLSVSVAAVQITVTVTDSNGTLVALTRTLLQPS